jgi:uncharacterized protein
MKAKWLRRAVVLVVFIYAILTAAEMVFVQLNLHLARRLPPPNADAELDHILLSSNSDLQDVTIASQDGLVLRAWKIRPRASNGNAVIILHGQGDNRFSQIGYAQILLSHGYSVLIPDARGHGTSDGELSTYGLRERDDIRRWFEWLAADERPHCIFGFGESMGGAQLLQALEVEPHFCAVAAESPFASLREISYDRIGQFFHTGPWLGRTLLLPVVEIGFLYTRWRYGVDMQQVSPENAVATTKVPVFLIHGAIDSNIPVRNSRRIQAGNRKVVLWVVPNADHCGALGAAPNQFQTRLLAWFAKQGVSR